jgi:hypothetical protein
VIKSQDVADNAHGLLRRSGASHGRLAWHHFFPEWLAALRFISGKKDPTLPALRPSSRSRRAGRLSREVKRSVRSTRAMTERNAPSAGCASYPGASDAAKYYGVSASLPCVSARASNSFCHSERCVAGAICTAVTLYSGQLVAQSLYSVVTTLAPVSGLWNVV